MYQSLTQSGEDAAAAFILDFIKDVDYELAEAEQKLLELEAIDYDITNIIEEQERVKKKYRNKLKEISLCMI